MRDGELNTQIEKGIGRLSFYHPKRNAMSKSLLQKLETAIQRFGVADAVRVIVLQSEGTHAFCAGAFFDELRRIRDFDRAKAFFMGFARVIHAMRSCPKLIIGRVQGKAVGGGVGLLAATDYVLASESASVRLSELALGLGPFVIEPALRHKMGTGAVAAIAIDTNNWKPATWALEKGLYQSLHPDLDKLDEAVNHLAYTLSEKSTAAMRALKTMLWSGTADWPDIMERRAARSGKLLLSDYTQAVLQKGVGRPPG